LGDLPTLDNDVPFTKELPEKSDPIYTPYSDLALRTVLKLSEKQLQDMRESFHDKVIVDIGAGRIEHGYNLACVLKAKGYVAVEPFNAEYFFENLLVQSGEENRPINKRYDESFKSGIEMEPIPFNIALEDGLSFLKRIPDNSVIVFTFGLGDNAAIADEEYTGQMRKEIMRVMVKDGYSISNNSLGGIPENSNGSEIIMDGKEGAGILKFADGKAKGKFKTIRIE